MKNKLKKYLILIIFMTILFGAVGYLISYYSKIVYTSNTTFLLKEEYSKEQFLTYTELGKSNEIFKKLSEETNLSIQKINRMITIKTVNNTKLLNVKVKGLKEEDVLLLSHSYNREYLQLLNENFENVEVRTISNVDMKGEQLNPIVTTTIFGLGGFIFTLMLSLLFGNEELKIKTHNDIKDYLKLKSLGVIPRYEDDKKGEKYVDLNIIPIKVLREPNSLMAESYRMIRTNLDFLDMKVINFTSTGASEGKSSTIINLALTFSMMNKRVLLLDCDLRKPSIHSWLKLNRTQGISDILVYNRMDEYQKYIQSVAIPNNEQKLDVLTAGSKVSNTSELFASEIFKNLIKTVRNDYDVILIDCPPISLITDAVIISKVVDGTVYITEYNNFNLSVIKSSIEQLEDVDANILGSIVTKVNYRQQKKLYGNKEDYYEKKYM